ncbi:hypothetical protein ONZ45_g8930 [Pleurotus djamor]|nr:hypothetical protein ONZ45_g8930 [Pleurotus djamor]
MPSESPHLHSKSPSVTGTKEASESWDIELGLPPPQLQAYPQRRVNFQPESLHHHRHARVIPPPLPPPLHSTHPNPTPTPTPHSQSSPNSSPFSFSLQHVQHLQLKTFSHFPQPSSFTTTAASSSYISRPSPSHSTLARVLIPLNFKPLKEPLTARLRNFITPPTRPSLHYTTTTNTTITFLPLPPTVLVTLPLICSSQRRLVHANDQWPRLDLDTPIRPP